MKTAAILSAALILAAPSAYAGQKAVHFGPQANQEGYHLASPFERTKALCENFADGSQRGFFAFGNQSYVAGAAIGAGIGNLIRHARSYDQCMTAAGYAHNN
ncbi:MAG: hypothetical protein WAN05_05635 [Roseiarcus sp.]